VDYLAHIHVFATDSAVRGRQLIMNWGIELWVRYCDVFTVFILGCVYSTGNPYVLFVSCSTCILSMPVLWRRHFNFNLNPKTDVAPEILSHDYVSQLSRAKKLQHAIANCTLRLLSHKQEMTNQLGQCLFLRQSGSVRHARLHAATLSRDKVAQQNRRCDIYLSS